MSNTEMWMHSKKSWNIFIFFSNKNVECARKDDNQKNHVEIENEDFHYVPEDEEDQLLSIKIQKTKKKNSKYTSMEKVKLKFFEWNVSLVET